MDQPGLDAPARRRGVDRLGAAAPVVIGLVLLVGLAAVALGIGRLSLRAAMEERVADRVELVRRFGRTGGEAFPTKTLLDKVRATPFSPTDAAANELNLPRFLVSPDGNPLVAAFIVDAETRPVGSWPTGTALDASVAEALADPVADALAGEIGRSSAFHLDGTLVWARTVPVGSPQPWGALVLVDPIDDSWVQTLYERLGPLGPGEGGMNLLDVNGVVVASWDPEALGTAPILPAALSTVTTDPVVFPSELDGRPSTRIVVRSVGEMPGFRFFEQTDDDLFADLRHAQAERDRGVVAVAGFAVLTLVVFSAWRQRAVRRSERRLDLLLRNAHDVVLVVDDGGALRFVSPAAEHMLRQDPRWWAGRPLTELVSSADADRVAEVLHAVRGRGRSSLLGVRLRTGDGRERWFDLVLADRPHPDVPGVLVTCHEIGDRKRLEEELAYQAGHDALTGLANRARFETELAELAASDGSLAVMVIDLDRFKLLNDRLGHAAGDAALQAVAEGLRRAVRDGDLVGRLGGDEFGILTPDVSEPAATVLADRVVAVVRAAWPAFDGERGLDASVGIAMATGPSVVPGRLVRAADVAMYEAKRAGGGRAEVVMVEAEEREASAAEPRPVAAAAHAAAELVDDRPAGVAAPVPAGDAGPTRRSLVARLRGAAVLVVSSVLVTAVAGAGVVQSVRAQDDFEHQRIDERAALLAEVAAIAARTTDPVPLVEVTASLPWGDDDPALRELLLQEYATSPALGADGVAALLDRDGDVLSSYPAGASVAVGADDAQWARALAGEIYSPELRFDGERWRFYFVIPVVAGENVEHVLAIGASVTATNWSSTLIGMGALRPGRGGASIVDAAGVASASWDPAAIGQQVVDPELLRDVGTGDPLVRRHVVDGEEQVTILVRLPTTSSERYAMWGQPAESLFGDLRRGQTARDLALFGLLGAAVMGLAVVNRRREAALRRNANRLDVLLQQAHDMVVLVGGDGRIRFASAAVRTHLGREPGEVVGRTLAELLGEEAARRVLAATGSADRATVGDVEVVGATGQRRLFDVDVAGARASREMGGVLLTCHEISERALLQQRLGERATRDPLTGLLNRAEFSARLDQLAEERPAGDHAVVFVDLDHFKPVNDRFGHHAGDELLKVVAARLTSAVRPVDVVCRLGGDEFAILLAGCDEARAHETAARLLTAVRAPVSVAGTEVRVDASIGVAMSRVGIDHPEQLVREADQAMYRVKHGGRGGFVVER